MHSPTTLGYFCAPPGHFWEWDCDVTIPDHEAIQWHGTQTSVVLRLELNGLLQELAAEGLPPLGAILLVLQAAQEDWDADAMRRQLYEAAQRFIGGDETPCGVTAVWKQVQTGLEQIHRLPASLRSGGPARRVLVRAVFEGCAISIPGALSQDIVAQFLETPSMSVFQIPTPGLNGIGRLLRDLATLEKIFRDWPAGGLEQRLRTGVDGTPSAPADLPLEVRDTQAVSEVSMDLFTALEREEGEPAQVAGVARRLTAILHVPKPVASRDELPVGGVSDISNRGDPSRLLMTELAWDDMTFAVRLAQGEALFTRRESPPAEPPPQRVVLLDAGIFLWGKPRLFALGAALALQRQRGAEAAGGRVFTLAGDAFVPVPLDTVDAVRDQLERLEPAPHPGVALAALLTQEPALFDSKTEVFLITAPAALEPVTRLPVWQELACRVPLHSVLVDRAGALVLARHSLAGSRVLSEARVDLDTLLGKPAHDKGGALNHASGQLPQFYQKRPWPLYHPAPPRPGQVFQLAANRGFVGVSTLNVVCWWHWRSTMGCVLFPSAPTTDLCTFTVDPDNDQRLFLIFRSETWTEMVLLTVQLDGGGEPACIALQSPPSSIMGVRFQSGAVVIHQRELVQAFAPHDGRLIASLKPTAEPGAGAPWFDGEQFHPGGTAPLPGLVERAAKPPPTHSKRHVINEVASVGFDPAGTLLVRKAKGRVYQLVVQAEGGMHWSVCVGAKGVFQELVPMTLPGWPDHGLRQATFSDGRRVIHDPRGFLHVINGGEHAQELSIVLVKGHTAAWSRQGAYHGERNMLWDEWPETTTVLKSPAHILFRPL